MDTTFDQDASVSADGNFVVFVAAFRNQSVHCSITRTALEQHFWLPTGASVARMLKAVTDGQQRIMAAAERRMLKAPGAPIALTAADFTDR